MRRWCTSIHGNSTRSSRGSNFRGAGGSCIISTFARPPGNFRGCSATCGSRPSAKCSKQAINVREPRYAISMALTAVVAAVVLSGLLLFVLWAGWGGAVGILSVVGAFLVWFYMGRRPDLKTGKAHRDGGGDAGMG